MLPIAALGANEPEPSGSFVAFVASIVPAHIYTYSGTRAQVGSAISIGDAADSVGRQPGAAGVVCGRQAAEPRGHGGADRAGAARAAGAHEPQGGGRREPRPRAGRERLVLQRRGAGGPGGAEGALRRPHRLPQAARAGAPHPVCRGRLPGA
eukprot:scaffold57971_cov54-Phaeocystis_antarctica.AAC.1